MPVRRRTDKRREEVTDQHEEWLHGNDKASGFIQFAPHDELAALWNAHSERLVAEHVTLHPGTRPDRWWQYEAPEPRQRLGGTGTPASEVLAYVPVYSYGLPAVWISQWQVNYYTGIAVDVHGNPIGDPYPSNSFKGVAINPDDPPTFESQATYLKRHGLFLAGEERRLKKADWETEALTQCVD
jgi:hypothetical protein